MNDIQEKIPRCDHVCLKDGMLAKIQKNVGAKMLPFQWRAQIGRASCRERV